MLQRYLNDAIEVSSSSTACPRESEILVTNDKSESEETKESSTNKPKSRFLMIGSTEKYFEI